VALIALGAPIRALSRRQCAAKPFFELDNPHAASLNACFASLQVLIVLLLSTFPPDILILGLNPIHETT